MISFGSCRPRCARATCASRWDAATLQHFPPRCSMPDARADIAPDAPLDGAIEAALAALGGIGERSVPIGPLTTYRVGGAAAVFARVGELDDLQRVAAAVEASGLPVVILGRGSNILVADAGFRGIVVSATALTDRFEIDVERAIVRAGSSVPLPVLARQCARRGLTGFEWAVGVPGSIGGAVRMNAGGHGSDIAASLVEVTIA